MNKKKKGNIPLKILSILFIIFIALFIANESGYYESKIRDEVVVTEEGIKEFEKKIKNGEEIDLTNFLNRTREDYSSNMSELGDNITSGVENFVSSSMGVLVKFFKSIF